MEKILGDVGWILGGYGGILGDMGWILGGYWGYWVLEWCPLKPLDSYSKILSRL